MNCAWRFETQRATAGGGFVLIEVTAALFIIGILVVSLCTALQRSCDAAAKLRARAVAGVTERGECSWTWGPMISAASWAEGPRLSLGLGEDCGSECLVGVWADGWPVGEWRVSREDGLDLGTASWAELGGAELVIRARVDDGAWGPPYRSVVPGVFAVSPLALVSPESGCTESDISRAALVMHAKSAGTPAVLASWTDAPAVEVIQDILTVLDAREVVSCSLEAYGAVQAWLGGQPRGSDVYW